MGPIKPETPARAPHARRIPAAARAIGVSRATIYRLEKAGKLRIIKIAGCSAVPEADLERIAREGATL